MPTSTRQDVPSKLHDVRRPRTTSCRADASVRPLGIFGFAATYRKNGHAPCGSMWASPPTNGVRVRIGASVFVGLYRRADRVVRPYKTLRVFADGVCRFAIAFCAGGVEPLPYGNSGGLYGGALVRSDLQHCTAQSFRHGFAVPPPFTQGRLWMVQTRRRGRKPHQRAEQAPPLRYDEIRGVLQIPSETAKIPGHRFGDRGFSVRWYQL